MLLTPLKYSLKPTFHKIALTDSGNIQFHPGISYTRIILCWGGSSPSTEIIYTSFYNSQCDHIYSKLSCSDTEICACQQALSVDIQTKPVTNNSTLIAA
jgi:hypothetical protein